jgi:murein DD-endopeptidase MepM/ murein hydrolase activator NlpD
MPPLPVRSDSAAGRPVRGALSFAPTYNDDFAGWPVAPKHRTHAVYGTFGNPTTKWPSEMPGLRAGYHKAIDILQNDATGRHPVFAIEGGTVRGAKLGWLLTPLKERVRSGVIDIAHFRYSHVAPSVEVGEKVEAGQEIGQTCLGFWHVHLEEYASAGGKRVHLNPLRAGGKLAPVKDMGNPFVREMRIYAKEDENNPTPRPLPPDRVRGVVVPVALAGTSIESLARFPTRSKASTVSL